MDLKLAKKWIKKIRVEPQENADVAVDNPTPLVLIGKGRQGAVFQIDDDTCVKIYGTREDCEREHYALSLGQHTRLVPRVYRKGAQYIIMEFIKGISLREYLQAEPLTKELSLKLIEMLVTFQQIGFERIDHHKRQIYMQPDGSLRVIDVGRTVWRDRTYPYPRKLLTSLGEEYKQMFLEHVRELAPSLYREWEHYIQSDQLARQICQQMLAGRSPAAPSEAEDLITPLLTGQDKKKYYAKLEQLVRKVFKEEWILLAQGKDPEKIRQKVSEHLKKQRKKSKSGPDGKSSGQMTTVRVKKADRTRPKERSKQKKAKAVSISRQKQN